MPSIIAKQLLPKIKEVLLGVDEFVNDKIFATLSEKATEWGVKSGAIFWVLRIAITGQAVTPGGATEIAALIGKDETLKRIDFSISLIG